MWRLIWGFEDTEEGREDFTTEEAALQRVAEMYDGDTVVVEAMQEHGPHGYSRHDEWIRLHNLAEEANNEL